MITEAGGLIGNFTGESDFLYQREVVAGTPKVYGQLVQMLAPYTRVIADPAEAAPVAPAAGASAAATNATAAFVAAAAAPPAARKAPLRISKQDLARGNDPT